MALTAFDPRFLYAAAASQSAVPLDWIIPGGAPGAVRQAACRVRAALVGQDGPIARLEEALSARLTERDLRWKTSMATMEWRDERPLACFLATGPTGTGKTETARLLAHELFGGRIVTLNGTDVGVEAPHGVATWVGSPPGYVGYNQGGLLTDGLRANRSCVILVDEIEKASPTAIQNVLLPLMGDGTVTDRNNGDLLSVTECVVFATSNLVCSRHPAENEAANRRTLSCRLSPELIGRFNAVLRYKDLGPSELKEIWLRQLTELERKRGRPLDLDTQARLLVDTHLETVEGGARGVVDLFRSTVLSAVANLPDCTMLSISGDRLVALRGGPVAGSR